MKVLLCGASDLELDIYPSFQRVVKGMAFDGKFFPDVIPGADSFDSWIVNSVRAVKESHMVVFALKEKSGEITWQHEYVKAINEGIPFIILISKPLSNKYFDGYKKNELKNVKNHSWYRAFQTLDVLLSHKRTIWTFSDIHNFEENLQKAILNEIEKGLNVLQTSNKRKSLIENVTNNNYKKFLASDKGIFETQHLIEMLKDVFEDKEIRKRVLNYFSINKVLSDNDIIELLNDGEQGVSRVTAELLPNLLGSSSDRKRIIDELIKIIEDTGDTGIIRRSISSIFDIDFVIALDSLPRLFPAYDIGTPKRILKWMLNNWDKIETAVADPKTFKKVQSLITLCESFSQKPETLKEMSKELKNLLDELKGK